MQCSSTVLCAIGALGHKAIAPPGVVVDFGMTNKLNHNGLCAVVHIQRHNIVAIVLRRIVRVGVIPTLVGVDCAEYIIRTLREDASPVCIEPVPARVAQVGAP